MLKEKALNGAAPPGYVTHVSPESPSSGLPHTRFSQHLHNR